MPFNDDTFLELKDCIFIKGLPTDANVKISDVREYFEKRIGECCVEMTALSKDKRWFFVAIKFKSPSVAEKVMERYDDNYICGHRVTMSYWRVPRSMTHSGRLLPNSYWGHKPNTRQWEHRENCDDEDNVCVRHEEEYSRERLSWDTKHAPSDPACRNERDNYGEESDNFRDYQDNNGRYKASDNYSYEEQAEDYLPQHWDSGGLEEGCYDDNRSGWDSDYNDSSENFSEREQYDKEEELPYHHEEHIWRESEVIRDNDQNFIDQTERWDYDSRYPELDTNREIYSEPYEGSLREKHGNGEYHGYQERPSEETSYRTENLCERNRDWHGGREHSGTQDLHAQRKENSQNNFSHFDHTNHWPKWEVVAPNNPTRRRLSDPDVLQEARRHNAWEQDFADQRSWNKSRDLTGRKAGNFLEERPRSDEWLNISRQHFQSRGRHSTSPVNLWSKDDSHQVFAHSEEIQKSSYEPFDNRTSVDRKHGGDFVHSMRSHCSSSPVRGKRSSPNTSKMSSSSERSSDFKLHETSPCSEKSSHSCNEHSSGTRQRDSRSYSPKGRHNNNRVPYDRGNAERTGTRRDCDLRRSLMLHQQRKHLSSLPRDRSREEGSKRSSLERGRKSSPDEHYRSSGSISSTDSTSPPKSGNRKRQHEDEKIRQDMETAKKRKQTSHSSLTHSITASRDNESSRNKAAKSSSESRKQPPGEQKRSTREPRDQVSSDKSNTGRANRLLSDLAATLAEDNISLKRPSPDTDVAQRKVESSGGHAVKSQGYTSRSKEYHKKCHPEEDEKMKQAVSDDNLQLVDSNGGDSCAKETVSELLKASEGDISTPMSRTTPLAAPSIGGNSDQDIKEVMGLYDRAKHPTDNSHNAEKSASSPNDKLQPLKPSPEHTILWSNSNQDANEATRFYEEDSAQLPEDNSHKTEKSASFSKDKFQPLIPAPEQTMLWDNSDQEVNKATGFYKDISTTQPRNIAFSPKGKLRSLKPSPEPLEFAEIKTNSTYIVDDFEETYELVDDKTVGSSNRKEFETLNPCLQHHDFAEIKTNGTFIVDDFENALDTVENGVSFKKASGVELLGQGGDGNPRTENCHVVDMEVSSDDQASPNVIQARNEFCYPVDTRNAGKGSVSNTAGEDECISKEASGDLTTTEQKTFEVEEFSLSGTGSVLYHTKPSMSSTEVSQVCIDTLKQGAYNTKHKASEAENTGTNNNGSCMLYTEPSIYTVQINDDRVDTLTQGSNNIKDCNGVNSRKRATCAVKKEDLNAIYTEQELSNCNSDELIKESREVDGFDSNPQVVSDKKHASIDVSSQRKRVHELNEALSDANCQDKMILKNDKEGHAKVTQGEVCHDNTVTEGCNMEDAITNSTEQKFSDVEGVNNVQGKRRDNKRQDTGREIDASSVFCDMHQRRNNDKEEDENETNLNIEWSSWRCIEAVATHRDQKSYDEKSIDVMPNKKGTSDIHNIETNAGNMRIGALNRERGVCAIESNDSTSCLSNAIQEGYNEKNIDCDITIAKKQKCDNRELKIYNMDDVFVTQQKRHFSKDVYPSGNARQESNSYVTQKEMLLSKEFIPGRVMQELSKTNVSYVGLKPQKIFNTDCPRFSVSIPEQAGDYSKISKVDPGIVKRRSSWPSVEPYQSNVADTNKSATSSLNTCKAVHGLQKTKDLVPESFDHLDMEISSDEEHLTDLAVRVVDGDSARKNDASKPYSPSSPTRKSDEHCSPHAKEEYSPYSPSHPTNVSEGDLEQNDPVKELCFDDEDDGASTCEAREEIIAGGFALKNSLKGIEAGRKERIANTTVFKQAIDSDSIGVTSVNSFTLSSSLKSKSGPSLRVSLAEGSVDASMPVDDATQCGGEKNNSECNKSDGKGGAACVVDFTADENGEDMKKPMRCPKRTQSLPIFSSVVPRLKVMYITATKTKHVKTDSGSLHKSRIFYAANDRIAKPVNSLSLDEMPSKDCIFGESSSYDSKNIKGPIVFETRQSNERKAVRDVKPVLTKRSGNSDSSLKLENIATQVSDLDMGKVGTPSKNAKTNNVLKVSAIEGCGSFTGSNASIDKEKVDISNTSITEQDSEEECSRVILKDKDTASGAAHFVQDTLCKDTVADDKAGNLMTTIKGTQTADFKVLPTSYSIASEEFDKRADKEINYSSKNCGGTPSTSIDDISSLGSVPEGEQTLVSKELRERTSLRSSSTSFRVEGSVTEIPSNCNHKVPEGIKRDTNCGSVDTPVTCEMIDKRPITSTCEMTKYGHDNNQTLLLGTYGHVESTVLEGEVGNRKDEIDKESLSNVPEQHVRTVRTLPTLSSRSGKKRSHPDQRKGSHSCKVPNKSLKLIIPSHQEFNGGANRAAKPGVNARKTSSCTVTRADLHFAPGNNGDPTSKLGTGAKEDMFASLNPRGIEKPRAKNLKKPASCTITSANLDFVPGNKSLPINESDMLTVDRCGIVNSELSSPSDRSAEIEGGSHSQGWHSTGNASPLSRHLALHNQHKETSHSFVGNIRIEEHREKGVLTEGKASFAGKESDWAAFKMERLRKKKKEIEQVYKRECQTVINVVKMLVSNDPRLEGVLQNVVRRSLQEMGQRCVQELEKEARPAT